MKKRIEAFTNIFERIKTGKDDIGLKSFAKGPANVPDADKLPACIMHKGEDSIIKRSNRSVSLIEYTRSVDIMFDIVDTDSDAIEIQGTKLRNYILQDIYPVLLENGEKDRTCHLVEQRFEGPMPFGVPGLSLYRLVLELIYTDNGQ